MVTPHDLGLPPTLKWQGGRGHYLQLLDQRRLPEHIEYLTIASLDDAWHAINTLAVRGAPAIGVAAAYALAQSCQHADTDLATVQRHADYLASARPTAVNLAWATNRLVRAFQAQPTPQVLLREAQDIHAEDQAACAAIGAAGAPLITAGARVLTHCNAGALAVTGIGTATAPLYVAHHRGVNVSVYADETRPLLQGARLTAWELERAGLSVTLLCDNMAASLMSSGAIDLVLVGTDRIAANGDVVNKIGTLNLAILCHHFGIPFYVACPDSSYDPHTPTGADVPIEQRHANEVRGAQRESLNVYNPAFDVTPAALVTGVITQGGIHKPQQLRSILCA